MAANLLTAAGSIAGALLGPLTQSSSIEPLNPSTVAPPSPLEAPSISLPMLAPSTSSSKIAPMTPASNTATKTTSGTGTSTVSISIELLPGVPSVVPFTYPAPSTTEAPVDPGISSIFSLPVAPYSGTTTLLRVTLPPWADLPITHGMDSRGTELTSIAAVTTLGLPAPVHAAIAGKNTTTEVAVSRTETKHKRLEIGLSVAGGCLTIMILSMFWWCFHGRRHRKKLRELKARISLPTKGAEGGLPLDSPTRSASTTTSKGSSFLHCVGLRDSHGMFDSKIDDKDYKPLAHVNLEPRSTAVLEDTRNPQSASALLQTTHKPGGHSSYGMFDPNIPVNDPKLFGRVSSDPDPIENLRSGGAAQAALSPPRHIYKPGDHNSNNMFDPDIDVKSKATDKHSSSKPNTVPAMTRSGEAHTGYLLPQTTYKAPSRPQPPRPPRSEHAVSELQISQTKIQTQPINAVPDVPDHPTRQRLLHLSKAERLEEIRRNPSFWQTPSQRQLSIFPDSIAGPSRIGHRTVRDAVSTPRSGFLHGGSTPPRNIYRHSETWRKLFGRGPDSKDASRASSIASITPKGKANGHKTGNRLGPSSYAYKGRYHDHLAVLGLADTSARSFMSSADSERQNIINLYAKMTAHVDDREDLTEADVESIRATRRSQDSEVLRPPTALREHLGRTTFPLW